MRSFTTFIFLTLLGLAIVGCEQRSTVQQQPQNVEQPSSPTPSATPPPTENPERASSMPITFPLLDAMLNDESFTNELKGSLNLTDDELTKLKDTSRNYVLQLGSDESDDSSRSTRSSVDETEREVKKILGQDRTAELFRMVRTRWSGGAESLAMASPNSVPNDTRIVVNAPAFRMDIFRDGSLVKTYKIGIGYPEFPLPTGLRRANEIIFNPTWTPPDEPWVKGKVQPGQKVEAGSKLNPLGPIKIPIGLPSLIHGGKNPARLGNFASHGCVGLTDAQIQDFAVQLSSLGGSQLTAEDVKEYEKRKTETENFKLGRPVPVELRYETIVVEDGKVYIYRDVYERGTNTEANLRRVLDAVGVSLDSIAAPERAKLLEAVNEMAVDASGDAVEPNTNSSANANTNSSNSGKVTRTIKGKKEIVIELAELKGKGYPAPVGLSAK